MKRLIALLMVSVLGLAACGAGDAATAATVNGQAITVGDVNGLLAIDSGTITKAQFAQFLDLLVEWHVVEDAAAEEFGFTVTQEEIDAETDRIYEQFSDEGQSREDFLATRGFTETFLEIVGHQEVLFRKIHDMFKEDGRGVPTEDDVEERMDAQRAVMTQACVSHILLGEFRGLEGEELDTAKEEALADAEEVLGLIEDGGDFAELAREHSVDTGSAPNGGDLGCASPAEYVPEFQEAVMDAPIGEVLGEPVESQFGYHIILVRTRETPPDEEVAQAIVDDGVSGAIDEWIDEKLGEADISVVERFGTWNSDLLRVDAPPA